MIHCILWRASVPGVVTYLRGLELDWEPCATASAALLLWAERSGL